MELYFRCLPGLLDDPVVSHFQTASSSGDPHVHIVKQVDSADEGLYTCIAGNVLGQARMMDSLLPFHYRRIFLYSNFQFGILSVR